MDEAKRAVEIIKRMYNLGQIDSVKSAITLLQGQISGVRKELDDLQPIYAESGTWTPVVYGSEGGTAAMDRQFGAYYRIGELVTCRFRTRLTSRGAMSGEARISGMPYAPSGNVFDGILGFSMGYQIVVANGIGLMPFALDTLSYIGFYKLMLAGTNVLSRGVLLAEDISNTSDIYGTITYKTD